MASIQNGCNENSPQSDDFTIGSIQNGNSESPPQLDDDVIKVVVVGESRCGKTSFIRQYYDHHPYGEIYSHNGVRVYPCAYEGFNQQRRLSIFEIPSNRNFTSKQRIPHYEEANIIVFMYAIDNPTSFQMLTERWIAETNSIIESNSLPIVIVGNKIDLRDDQQVIESLALENQNPVTFEQANELVETFPGSACNIECSANDLKLVEYAFNNIFVYAIMTD